MKLWRKFLAEDCLEIVEIAIVTKGVDEITHEEYIQ
jgi:hypothetical protein